MKKIIPPEWPVAQPSTLEYAHGKYPNRSRRRDPRRALTISALIAIAALIYISIAIQSLRSSLPRFIAVPLMLLFLPMLIGTAAAIVISAIHFNAPWPYRGRARLLILINAIEFLALIGFLAVIALAGLVLGGRY